MSNWSPISLARKKKEEAIEVVAAFTFFLVGQFSSSVPCLKGQSRYYLSDGLILLKERDETSFLLPLTK